MAVKDVVVDGHLIKAGEFVLCSVLMADRDPALTPDPQVFDAERDPAPHLAFGHGIHHCIGAAVARAVLRLAYRTLWLRLPGLRLAVPVGEVRLRDAFIDSPDRLPVTW
jgi:oxidation protein CepF/oxidation protein CepG